MPEDSNLASSAWATDFVRLKSPFCLASASAAFSARRSASACRYEISVTGESIGANPTPVAYAELYTALQTGAVDGQDNPLVSSKLMKFDEVTSQFVLTRHVIGYDVMVIRAKIWDAIEQKRE